MSFTANPGGTALQLRSLIRSSGELELSIVDMPVPEPKPGEVLVRMEAAPLNPSDLGLLFDTADMATLQATGPRERRVVTARIPPAALHAMADRLDVPMTVGNEGAGTVVAAGDSPAARALMGRLVAAPGGSAYGQVRCVPVDRLLVLPDGATAVQGASCFVNPLTALAMVETMRRDGHKAIVHTAAASNLGQMLERICRADGIGLVNVVRRPEQAALLRAAGAPHVCDTSAPGFRDDLVDAIAATGATLAFDATGGGTLAGQILLAMEAATRRTHTQAYSRYGSSVLKQLYFYGSLDRSPVSFERNFGMAWTMGGFLLFPKLEELGAETQERLKARVAAELTTTFASHYAQSVSLAQMLVPETIAIYNRRATGTKYLVTPNG